MWSKTKSGITFLAAILAIITFSTYVYDIIDEYRPKSLDWEVVVVSSLEDELNFLEMQKYDDYSFVEERDKAEKRSKDLNHIVRALNHGNEDDFQSALNIANKRLAENDSDGVFLKAKAEILIKMKRYEEAIFIFEFLKNSKKTEEKDKNYFLNNVGVGYILDKKYVDADLTLTLIHKKLVDDPNKITITTKNGETIPFLTIVSNNLAIAKSNLGNNDEAIQILKWLVLRDYDNYMTHNNLAVIYFKLKQFEHALESIGEAIQFGESLKILNTNKDKFLIQLENSKNELMEAIVGNAAIEVTTQTNIHQTRDIDPPTCTTGQFEEYLDLAEKDVINKVYISAKLEYEKILRCMPEEPYLTKAKLGLAYVLSEMGPIFYETSKKTYLEIIDDNPENLHGLTGFGYLHIKLKQYDDARQWCDKAIKIDNRFYLAYNCLGEIEKDLGNFVNSANAFSSSLKIKSENNIAYNGLGFVNLFKSKFDDSIGNYTKMLNYDSKNQDALTGLGLVFFLQGNNTAAASYFEKVDTNAINEYVKLIARADESVENGNYKSALMVYSSLERKISDEDNKKRILTGIGNSYKGLREYSLSEQYYLKTLEIDHKDVNALKGLCSLSHTISLSKKSENYPMEFRC